MFNNLPFTKLIVDDLDVISHGNFIKKLDKEPLFAFKVKTNVLLN